MKATYQQQMENGHAALDVGDHEEALAHFQAARSGLEFHEAASAEQMIGICARLTARLDLANVSFSNALEIAEANGDICRHACTLRDWAIVALVQCDFKTAIERIETSIEELRHTPHVLEFWASWGFRGRPYIALGDLATAYRYLSEADENLRGHHPTYELNNLMQLLRAAPLQELPRLSGRAYVLAQNANNFLRQAEIVKIFTERLSPF